MRGVSIEFEFFQSVPDDMLDSVVNFVLYINVIRFFKECVVNAVKHSGATLIKSSVTISPDRVIIAVKDNGKGFDANVKKGRGLKNLYRRVSQIDGIVRIKSSDGTEITCDIPLKENHG